MVIAVRLDIARLVLKQRWGALATLDSGAPLASMVAYAPEPDLSGLLGYLSDLHATMTVAYHHEAVGLIRCDRPRICGKSVEIRPFNRGHHCFRSLS